MSCRHPLSDLLKSYGFIEIFRMKKGLGFLFILLIIATFGAGWHLLSAGFRLNKIWFELPDNANWRVSLDDKELNDLSQILNQEFTYLGKGRQSYVFESKDHKHVIKFFRYHLVRPRLGLHLLKFSKKLDDYRKYRIHKKHQQFEDWMNSYKVAYDELRDESGIVYVHLVRTDAFHKKVHVKDKLGRSYHIDLDNVGFLIQKKTELFSSTIRNLVKKHDIAGLKKIIHVYLETLATRNLKGIKNKDHSWIKNYGNIGLEEIYEIDTGRYSFHQPSLNEHELFVYLLRYAHPLQKYLQDKMPEIIPYYHEEICQVAKRRFAQDNHE